MGFAAGDIEGADAVIESGIFLGGQIPLALRGEDMDEYRSLVVVPHGFKSLDQVFQFVAGNRADIIEFQRFEEHTGGEETFEAFLALAQDVEDVFTDV